MTTLTQNSVSEHRDRVVLLQTITIGWMLIECAVSLFSAARAHSPALLAFGADSLVELLSAVLVLVSISARMNRKHIDRAAGILLILLAVVVCFTSGLALAGKLEPKPSISGLAITIAALFVMPVLTWQKRKLARQIQNNALAADAVQSATCAYLALISIAGLALNAIFQLPWADSIAALIAVPLLLVEARRATRGESCGCSCH